MRRMDKGMEESQASKNYTGRVVVAREKRNDRLPEVVAVTGRRVYVSLSMKIGKTSRWEGRNSRGTSNRQLHSLLLPNLRWFHSSKAVSGFY
jgi:hypothetical protein